MASIMQNERPDPIVARISAMRSVLMQLLLCCPGQVDISNKLYVFIITGGIYLYGDNGNDAFFSSLPPVAAVITSG